MVTYCGRIRFYPLFMLFSCVIFFSTCGKRRTAVESGIEDQVLHIGNGAEPQDLDPHIVTGVPEHAIISALLEGLVAENPKDLHPVPGAAEKWDISDDRRVYTFYLRDNGRWSNGDPVTAHDFVYSFRRILSPALGSEYSYMLYCMRNAERYNKGEIDDFSLVGAAAVDSHTLVITLGSPTPYFLSLLAHYSWFPVHPGTIEKHGAIDRRGSKWTRAENYTGNGPFVLNRWEVNRVIIAEKSPTYWDADNVRLNAIHFHPIESEQTEERAFRSGQLHVTNGVPSHKIEYYRENSPELLRIDPYLGTYYYLVNTVRPPLDNPLVRRALSTAIDRTAIVENVLKGGQLPAHHFTPPGTAGYTACAHIASNPEKARELLARAGYPGGNGFPQIEVLYNTLESHQLVAQAIQEMWKKELGIEVSLINQEWKVFLNTQKNMEFDISRAGWIGD
ncbi:MAG: peptide ABC transporter substrate-binding protein, partial [Chitinivibrionales bacterium]|nr:peptide ABC transporter substrate-binding protein [Chitinivibrionales bacterium]